MSTSYLSGSAKAPDRIVETILILARRFGGVSSVGRHLGFGRSGVVSIVNGRPIAKVKLVALATILDERAGELGLRGGYLAELGYGPSVAPLAATAQRVRAQAEREKRVQEWLTGALRPEVVASRQLILDLGKLEAHSFARILHGCGAYAGDPQE